MTHDLLPSASPVVLEDHPPVDKPERYPVRQRWHAPGAVLEGAAAARLTYLPRYLVTTGGRSGELWAINERALADARGALQQALPPGAVRFAAPHAHRLADARTGEPLVARMFVRVQAPRAQLQPLLAWLRERRARLHEVEQRQHCVIVRAEGALDRLLGLDAQVRAAAGGPAQVASWLVRYEPAAAAAPVPAPALVPPESATSD